MVKYLSKFVLEVLPSVFATVVGAYIVAHYINPKVETPKTEVVATAPAGEARDAADATGTVEDKATDTKATDAKATDAKVSDAKAADPKLAEAAKVEAVKVESAKAKTARPDERKNAIELARAAIERLRGPTVDAPPAPAPQPVRAPTETARVDEGARATVQPAASPRAPGVVPVMTTGVAPQPAPATSTTPPPLPPPVIVASPYGRHSVGPEAAAPAAPAEQPADQPTDRASADRPTPPADIPFQRGYDLQAQATPVEHVSIGDHLLSTTKSFFRALTPNSQSN